jgi:hypothetical protein
MCFFAPFTTSYGFRAPSALEGFPRAARKRPHLLLPCGEQTSSILDDDQLSNVEIQNKEEYQMRYVKPTIISNHTASALIQNAEAQKTSPANDGVPATTPAYQADE